MDHRLFGGRDFPLRISGLPSLIGCPMREFLLKAGLLEDRSGQAAQTGSVAHEMIHLLHARDPFDVKGAIDAVDTAAGRAKFPLADFDAARKIATHYSQDPRNKTAKVTHGERRVALTLKAHTLDPTGEPISLVGTLDQIRLVDERHLVCDVKTGKTTGLSMLDCYALQIAGYTLAARQTLGIDAEPGYIIRTEGYGPRKGPPESSPDGIFFRVPLTVADCESLLEQLTREVAMIRRGEIDARPGYHCQSICPARGLQHCLPTFNRFAASLPVCP